ncbi:MAG: conjugal transfer protein TrbF [Alphaproteobacteria bacterium]|nr:conjugal transfer protein TrbF [Alphaproteobacteria bacterium]
MIFKRSTTTYGQTPAPETPYQRAAQIWDDRIGAARVQARNWRFMAFGCLVLALGLSGGVIWQTGRSTITPYVVEVDTLGAVRAIGPAIAAYEPTDAQIAHHLARFVENVRSLSIDPIIVRQNWLRAYDYATARAANTLNDYAREKDPFSQVGSKTVTVEVTSIVRASDDSFEVRWLEITYVNGSRASSARYTGVLSIVLQRPRTEEALRQNPLGVYVHALNWSRDLIAGDEE